MELTRMEQRAGYRKIIWLSALCAAYAFFVGIAQVHGEMDADAAFYEETDVGEREPAASGAVAGQQPNQARYRLYPGGQDEEDLRVQDALPIPTRLPDGSSAAPLSTGQSSQED